MTDKLLRSRRKSTAVPHSWMSAADFAVHAWSSLTYVSWLSRVALMLLFLFLPWQSERVTEEVAG